MSRDILLHLIDTHPGQPRTHFDQGALDELAQSMAANGLAVPILVRPVGERFIIVHGERRYRAAGLLQWKTIPADVRDISLDEAQWLALVENIQRADLSPIEEARAYQAHIDAGITQTALGQRIGKTQSYIAQKLRLLTLPSPLTLYIGRSALSEGHARQLLRLKSMYGEEVTVTLDARTLTEFTMNEAVTPDNRVTMCMVALRIEDLPWPPFYSEKSDSSDLLLAGCQAFAQHVAQADGTVPLWELAVFVWATAWTFAQGSVADLKAAIDAWHDRFLSALGWWYVCGYGKQKPDSARRKFHELHDMLWWGYSSDLRHGRIKSFVEAHGLPRYLELEAIEYIGKTNAFALPSQLHPQGEQYQRYQQLSAEMG
jgi:ParB/RepB/Spo0J family partition protein